MPLRFKSGILANGLETGGSAKTLLKQFLLKPSSSDIVGQCKKGTLPEHCIWFAPGITPERCNIDAASSSCHQPFEKFQIGWRTPSATRIPPPKKKLVKLDTRVKEQYFLNILNLFTYYQTLFPTCFGCFGASDRGYAKYVACIGHCSAMNWPDWCLWIWPWSCLS